MPGEIVPSREFYDYEAKYIDSGSRTEIPRDARPTTMARDVRRQAVAAFEAIDGAGLARVDFLLSRIDRRALRQRDQHLPGFTTISMFSKLWARDGVDYPTLVDRLIALALERHAEKQELEDERVLTTSRALRLCLTVVFCSSIIYILRESDHHDKPIG